MAEFRPILMSTVQYDPELRSGQRPLTEILQVAKRLGVDGVELRDVYWADKSADLPTCRRLSEELGLRLAYATFARLFGAEPNGRESVRQAIEDGAALGAPIVRIFPGPVPDDADGHGWAGARELIDLATKRGIVLALENYSGTPGGRLDEIEHVLRQIDSPTLGTNVDIGNYNLNGQDIPAAIRALGPRIVYSHLKHNRRVEDKNEATYLGGGDLPLDDTIAEFGRLAQPVTYCFEFAGGGDPEGRIQKSLDYLRGVSRSAA
ncbi:MAG TPA: sugar phosphate isomerase/epimerase family protein [Chloroflexota bacterium]